MKINLLWILIPIALSIPIATYFVVIYPLQVELEESRAKLIESISKHEDCEILFIVYAFSQNDLKVKNAIIDRGQTIDCDMSEWKK